jgi:hypothetical protein
VWPQGVAPWVAPNLPRQIGSCNAGERSALTGIYRSPDMSPQPRPGRSGRRSNKRRLRPSGEISGYHQGWRAIRAQRKVFRQRGALRLPNSALPICRSIGGPEKCRPPQVVCRSGYQNQSGLLSRDRCGQGHGEPYCQKVVSRPIGSAFRSASLPFTVSANPGEFGL